MTATSNLFTHSQPNSEGQKRRQTDRHTLSLSLIPLSLSHPSLSLSSLSFSPTSIIDMLETEAMYVHVCVHNMIWICTYIASDNYEFAHILSLSLIPLSLIIINLHISCCAHTHVWMYACLYGCISVRVYHVCVCVCEYARWHRFRPRPRPRPTHRYSLSLTRTNFRLYQHRDYCDIAHNGHRHRRFLSLAQAPFHWHRHRVYWDIAQRSPSRLSVASRLPPLDETHNPKTTWADTCKQQHMSMCIYIYINIQHRCMNIE